MNLANKLTLFRIILVPIFIVLMAVNKIPYGVTIGTIVFIIASITDKLDGYIARSRNQITNFGKFMDPLADKLLVISALVCLIDKGVVPSWAVIIIIARELAVSGLRTIAASEGIILAAGWWGKIKTVLPLVALIGSLLQLDIAEIPVFTSLVEGSAFLTGFFNYVPMIAFILAVIATIFSGLDYFYKNKNVLSTNK